VRDVNIVVGPPPQMAANLKAGNLDGYCVGEPWNSLAVVQRVGWIAALSPAIAPRHPEKVLLVRADFAESSFREHERLIAALCEACEFCQRAENRERVVETLAAPKYLNINREAIQRSLFGPFKLRQDQESESAEDLHVFAGPGVNEPGLDKAEWVLQSLTEIGVVLRPAPPSRERLASMFRSDIFHAAIAAERCVSPE
jgi:ABC-type nitrate/sulfonate/bicarbonate transport system substrate-binding protein